MKNAVLVYCMQQYLRQEKNVHLCFVRYQLMLMSRHRDRILTRVCQSFCSWTEAHKKFSTDFHETLYDYGLLMWEDPFQFLS